MVNENLPFTVTVTWEVFGQILPPWLAGLNDPEGLRAARYDQGRRVRVPAGPTRISW